MLDDLALPWVRIEAIDGAQFGDLPWNNFDDFTYRYLWGKVPHPNELGCYLSHIRALETFLATNAPHAIVVEDDAVFADDMVDVVTQLIQQPDDWDIVKLESRHWGMPITVMPLRNGRRLVAYTQRSTGATAYLLSRSAAAAYVRKLLPMKVPYDHAFDQVWRFGLRMRGVLPVPARSSGDPSEIGYAGKYGSKRWVFRRTVAPLYRALIESARIFHYLVADPVWLRWLTSLPVSLSNNVRSAKGAVGPPPA